MQSRPSFRPIPTPTTPGMLMRRASCFRLTALTFAILGSPNASVPFSRHERPPPAGRSANLGNLGNRRRLSEWRGADEFLLHEEFLLLAGSPNQFWCSLGKA